MKIKLRLGKGAKDSRAIVSYGYSLWRYPSYIFFGLAALALVADPFNGWTWFIALLSFSLVWVSKNARVIRHDDQNLYLIKGKYENAIPFLNIISIMKSKSKLNGSRFWILKYTEEDEKERTIRFFSDFNKEFHTAVRTANPKVLIRDHPFFYLK